MATIKNGILGGLSGKVGPVVGVRLGDQYILRARPQRSKPFTKKELENQEKFGIVQKYLAPFIDLLKVGFKNYYTKTGGFRAAVSYTRKNAIMQGDSGFYIEPGRLKISGGDLQPAIDPQIAFHDDNLNIFWKTDSVNYLTRSDQLLVLLYDFENHYAVTKIFDSAYRSEGKATVEINPRLTGKKADLYIGFVAADRSSQSDSQYLGRFTL
ncbi:hypothetical protein GJU39_19560 [Pedobacter petrophilus]|uniref:Uncharacterized protein n=1 Tax=Pedobacter petrophilus TaxID=1908241 RepID=A0A7K0G392_9SPHI|nr:DUF6266 family protein [Pedobacter petrophilus]MRX78283.1 hypothetical protein [Pedobacter petrophilus]